MLRQQLILLVLALGAFAAPQNFAAKEIPAEGDVGDGVAGGIFGLKSGSKRPSQQAGPSAFAPGKDSPKVSVAYKDSIPTGPYPADYSSDPTLPNHTIFAPKTPPKGVKLPVVIWGNGGCASAGTSYGNMLREIASHGFIVVANGGTTASFSMQQTTMKYFSESLDWVTKGANGGKYGEVDVSKIATAGQSCGGLEAYAGSYHDERVKTVIVMNSGILDEEKRYLLNEFKVPIAYFIGGPKDIAYVNVSPPFLLRRGSIR
jgi:hypothetical protein